MNLKSSYQTKLVGIFKIVLLLATFGFIFYKLFYAYHFEELVRKSSLPENSGNYYYLAGAIVFMFFNWFLEVIKWRLLLGKGEEISFQRALAGVLSGITLSIITPNQVGDFAGRVMYLKQLNKIKGVLITVIGHTAQMIMTAVFGLIALIWLLADQGKISDQQASLCYWVLALLSAVTVIAYLNIHIIARLNLGAKVNKYLEVFQLYNRSELAQVLILSFLRYTIFLVQYELLLHFFGVNVTLMTSLACIIGILCSQSFIPSFILVELGMRGASALWFFGMYTSQVTEVLLSAYFLWIINLMIPGLIGLIFVLKWKAGK